MSSVTSSSSLSSVVSRFKSKTVNLAGAAHIGITGSRVYAIEVFCQNFKQVYATGRGVLGSVFSHHPSMYAKLSFEIIPWASHIGASLQMFLTTSSTIGLRSATPTGCSMPRRMLAALCAVTMTAAFPRLIRTTHVLSLVCCACFFVEGQLIPWAANQSPQKPHPLAHKSCHPILHPP